MGALTIEEFALAVRLRDAGIPLEEGLVKAPKTAPPRLVLTQVGSVLDSRVTELGCGGTGYVIEVSFGCDLCRMTISGWILELPWEDPQFCWLDDPRECCPGENAYHLPGEGPPGYQFETVMNHRRRFRRGDFVQGTLLAYGFEPIPAHYTHGSSVEAILTLFDHVQRGTSATVSLSVDRSMRFSAPPKKLRRRLFDTGRSDAVQTK